MWATLSRDRPVGETAQRLRVVPFSQFPGSGQTYILPTLIVMSAMGMLVLLIACANIAGLVLVRGLSRRGEIAVRLALGATRARIVRLLVLENLVLAVPGAVLGVVLSWQGIPPLVNYAEWLAAPQRLFFNIDVDGLVIAFTVVVACVSAVVFGLAPALQSTRVDLVSVINEDASPRGAARGRLRAALVVVQVAVSLLLLVGAGLTMRSVEAAKRADAGFDPTQVTADRLERAPERLRRHARPDVLPAAAGDGADRCRRRVGDPRPVTIRWRCSTPGPLVWPSTATSRDATRISPSCRTWSAPTTSSRCGSH